MQNDSKKKKKKGSRCRGCRNFFFFNFNLNKKKALGMETTPYIPLVHGKYATDNIITIDRHPFIIFPSNVDRCPELSSRWECFVSSWPAVAPRPPPSRFRPLVSRGRPRSPTTRPRCTGTPRWTRPAPAVRPWRAHTRRWSKVTTVAVDGGNGGHCAWPPRTTAAGSDSSGTAGPAFSGRVCYRQLRSSSQLHSAQEHTENVQFISIGSHVAL